MKHYRLIHLTQVLALIVSMALWQPDFALALPQKTESFWQKILRISGISATPRNQRNDEKTQPGQIWLANFQNGSRVRIPTLDTGYSSPIFLRDPGFVLALQGEKVVKISVADGTVEAPLQIKGIFKLVGLSMDDADNVLVLTDQDQDGCPTIGLLSLSGGQVTPLPYGKSQEDQRLINHLHSWARVYDEGDTKLTTEKKNGNTWVDVVFKEKDKDSVNVSRCQNVNCTQPSLSDDHKRVVFIKEN